MMKAQAILFAGLLCVFSRAAAALIATDNFDYANGSVAGRTGGSGWNNQFVDEVGAPAQSPSDWDVDFGNAPAVAAGALATNGGGARREFGGAGEGSAFPSNEREGAFRGTGRWFLGVTVRIDALAGAGTAQWAGVSSIDFGTERLFWGMTYQTTATRYFGFDDPAYGATLSSIPVAANTTYMMVAMLDFDNDRMALWVNPDGNDTQSSYDVSRAYTGTNWSSAVRLASSSGTGAIWDNIRIATTFAEAVPEPSAAALAALGLLAASRRRRA